jgi:hypothetical protein
MFSSNVPAGMENRIDGGLFPEKEKTFSSE